VTNRGTEAVEYEVRGAFTPWGGPYKLAPGESHDFKVNYPVILRQKSQGGEVTHSLTMGDHFTFTPAENTLRPPTMQANTPKNDETN
jgi:hypothetical protein